MLNDQERLAETEEELAEVRQHMADERRFIARAVREGHHTHLAERTLEVLDHFRRAITQHRRILLERLGLYRS